MNSFIMNLMVWVGLSMLPGYVFGQSDLIVKLNGYKALYSWKEDETFLNNFKNQGLGFYSIANIDLTGAINNFPLGLMVFFICMVLAWLVLYIILNTLIPPPKLIDELEREKLIAMKKNDSSIPDVDEDSQKEKALDN